MMSSNYLIIEVFSPSNIDQARTSYDKSRVTLNTIGDDKAVCYVGSYTPNSAVR